ncbi:DUF1080 domain-containing protein [Isosphaeraceae bacterium EP7]
MQCWNRRRAGLVLAVLSTLASIAPRTHAEKAAGEKSVRLFNGKDLSGWTTFLVHRDKAIDPRSDPLGVFKVEDGLIHVSGQEFGGITTEGEYENYRLRLDVKWGAKKWPPRMNVVRDSGVLLHCVGPDKVWTKSIECQIQEHDTGDFWVVDGATIEVDGKPIKTMSVKKKDAEKPTGEWNTVEVVCDGGRITNIVNGVVVNEGTNASVTRGRILLQSEGAEVFFRNIELTPLR